MGSDIKTVIQKVTHVIGLVNTVSFQKQIRLYNLQNQRYGSMTYSLLSSYYVTKNTMPNMILSVSRDV